MLTNPHDEFRGQISSRGSHILIIHLTSLSRKSTLVSVFDDGNVIEHFLHVYWGYGALLRSG